MDSLTEEEMEQMPFTGIKFSFLELNKLIEVLNQAKTAPWLSDVQMAPLVASPNGETAYNLGVQNFVFGCSSFREY